MNALGKHVNWTNAAKATAYLLGAHTIHIGIWAYIHPQSLCRAFGLQHNGLPYTSLSPAKSVEQDKKLASDGRRHENYWPLLFAAREFGLGVSIFVLAGLGDWRAVGILVGMVAGLVATTDGVVAGLFSEGRWRSAVVSHGVPAVVLAPVAMVLLYC